MTLRSVEMRRVQLPRDRTLVIRPIEPDDVDDLVRLHEGLDQDERYRRFFSMSLPRRSFFERMVVATQRDGACLAADIVDPSGTRRIVAAANYELLPNGDGELAIVVDTLWRGWLGPYLLDALIELAAAHGVPNLEADVLWSNRPMLALLRGRGYVVMPRDDFTTLRAVIGTSGRFASWPGQHAGPRVLIEGDWGGWRGRGAGGNDALQVLACPGPLARQRSCPALDGEACPLAASADAIVVASQSDGEAWSALRSAHPRLHPDVPVCVVLRGCTDQTDAADTELRVGPDVDLVSLVEAVATAHARRSAGDRRHRFSQGSS